MQGWIPSTTVISRAWMSEEKRKDEGLYKAMGHSDIYPVSRKEKGEAGDLKGAASDVR